MSELMVQPVETLLLPGVAFRHTDETRLRSYLPGNVRLEIIPFVNIFQRCMDVTVGVATGIFLLSEIRHVALPLTKFDYTASCRR